MDKQVDLHCFISSLQTILALIENKPKDNYSYYDGNNVEKIENVYMTTCKVSNNNEKNKHYDSIVVKYKNKDNILCSFHLLLKQLKSFDFSTEIYSFE